MRYKDKKYTVLGYSVIERIAEYYMEDIINSDNIPLFALSGSWKGYADNYYNFLHKGKYKKISPEYRYRIKNLLTNMITKLYFKMLVEDLIAGNKVTIDGKYDIFITNRSSNSPKFKGKKIEYLPYIRFHKKVRTRNGYYMLYFTGKYQRMLKLAIRRGKRYRIKNE